jgi:hypothetical protein
MPEQMNGNGRGRNQPWPNRGTTRAGISLEGLTKSTDISSVSAKIQTQHLHNESVMFTLL